MGGDIITENQALASFDFLATTGDSDSDEEEEEEDEEREDEEGDPTVAVDDEFTAGLVNDFEPMPAGEWAHKMYIHVHVNMCGMMFRTVCLGHLGVWGELASHKRLFNPPSQFSRLGIQVSPLYIYIYILVCMGW